MRLCRNIEYGPIEKDEEATPVGRVAHGWDGREFVVWERPLRQKVYETWRDEAGQKWGRWTWRYL